MIRSIKLLLANNRRWARLTERTSPGFFKKLSLRQSPAFFWIGCSDSRVPANEIVGLLPGEVFVHRNVANLVNTADVNCLSALQYAVDVLRVRHVIVCGHYGCGGIQASLRNFGGHVIHRWLHPIRKLADGQAENLSVFQSVEQRADRLCELNVIEQVRNVCRSPIVRRAWSQGKSLAIHGWIYRLSNGVIQPLGKPVTAAKTLFIHP
jgi:carbonic anhydrase